VCGIAGFIDFNLRLDNNILQKMNSRIEHRGRDFKGFFFKTTDNYNIGLTHTRLAIIDAFNKKANQPMQFKKSVIVYNGEIYNFKDIKKELMQFGYSFNTNSDTEVILKAFDKWGVKCVEKFRGMFAFAILKDNKLFIIRDRVGIKPLYYSFMEDKFLFGSELKSFEFLINKKIDKNALYNFFSYGYIKHPLSIFEGVYKLSPGEYLIFDLNTKKIKKNKYWQLKRDFKYENFSISDIENLLKESINLRLVSDVDVGIFFSGGIDSTLVASLVDKKLDLFFIEFEGKENKEVEKISKILNKNLEKFVIYPKDIKEAFLDFSYIYDEPFGDNSAIPTMLLSKYTSKKVKVVLSGDGGDELFFGYDRYRYLKKYNFISKVLKLPFYKFLKDSHFKDKITKLTLIDKYSIDILSRVYLDADLVKLLNFNFKKNFFEKNSFDNRLDLLVMKYDLEGYLADYILTKVDRASMFYSLEAREPLLDHKVVEMAYNLPFEMKYKNNISKWVLKKILEKYIPKELIYKDKEGFSFPLKSWIRDELKDIYFEFVNEKNLNHNLLNKEEVMRISNQFFDKGNINPLKVWFILVFQMWYKKWM
jgi:asparagine synthase (glutamine-hydrolysing)